MTRDRVPKKAFHVLRGKLGGVELITSRVKLREYPKVTVIVCSYNGGKTLGDCLRALDAVNYPDFEIVLVDDGSKDDTQQIVAAWLAERVEISTPEFVSVIQPNMGLSYARNAGAHAATGEVFAYTDSDCMADPDWLYYLVGTLLSGELRGRRRAEYFAAGSELDSGRRLCGAGRAEPRAAHGCRGGAHSRLQHGVSSLGFRQRGRVRSGVSQSRRRRRFLLAVADQWRRDRVQPERHRLALSAVHFAGFSQATGRLRRGGVDAALQASHLFRTDRAGEMEGANLRCTALYVAAESAGYLPRRLWPRAFPVDLPRAAERGRGVCRQHRMGRADGVHLCRDDRVSRICALSRCS